MKDSLSTHRKDAKALLLRDTPLTQMALPYSHSPSSVLRGMNRSARLVLVVALLAVRTALALDPQRHIAEIAHRSWGSKDGAPADVWAMAQTTDGFLWLGSSRGLYRFDGTLFQSFEQLAASQLPSRQVRSLFASPNGTLWIGYWRGGVSALEAGRLTNYTSAGGFPEGFVNGFAQDRSGRIWAASSGGLARFEGGRWRTVGKEWNFPGLGAQAVFVDHRGALWVAAEHRIAVLSPGSFKFELTDEPYNGEVSSLAEAPDGTVWMAETSRAVRPLLRPGQATPWHGLTRADCQTLFPNTWDKEPRCRRPNDVEVRVGSAAILFDRDGGLWITTLGDGLRRAPYPLQLRKEPIGQFSTAIEQFTSKDGLSADFVRGGMLEDREGNIWVATRDGLDQFRDSDLAAISLGPSTGSISIAAADDGYVFALDASRHLFRLRNSRDKELVRLVGPGNISPVYRDALGSIWATENETDSACRLVGDRCVDRIALPAKSFDVEARFAMDARSRLWTYLGGLFVRDHGQWSQVPSGLTAQAGFAPATQFTDASGQIWFGFNSGQLLTVNEGHVRTYSSNDGLTVGKVESIYSRGTHVWVGGEHGLARLSGSRFTAVVPFDLPVFDGVTGVVEADDGSLWLTEYRGVVYIRAPEVERIFASAAYRAHYELLNSLDGLPGETEQIYLLPTAIRGTDGRLWFTASRGIAWVDPRRLYRNKLPPPVVIRSVAADGNQLALAGSVELPSTTTNLQIAYSGLSLSVPERVQFRYRLTGLDREWQNVGTRRTAYYEHLPPGAYDFEVKASNDAGVWNDVGTSLRIRIIPAWYQTWWFYALCVLLVAAALAAWYRVRLAQVRAGTRRLLEARLSERERIARDLHDTLLQGFQGLMFRLQAVRELLPERPGDAERSLESAMEAGDQAIGEGRDAVQSLRSSSADDRDLATSLGALGSELGVGIPSESKPQYRVVLEGRPRELAGDICDDAYRIVREAVRNAFQHAKARHVEIELNFGVSDLCIRVRDDGIGVDPQILAHGQRPGHWGLPGMRERSESFGGRLHVWSERNAGTEVELRIPANVAYIQRSPSTVIQRRGPLSRVLGRRTVNRGG